METPRTPLETWDVAGLFLRVYSLNTRRHEILVWTGVHLHSGCLATPTSGHSEEWEGTGMPSWCLPRFETGRPKCA